jgi:hypothetical protein
MKFGHMDGRHCIIDNTSILIKIKSFALYNCRTVYFQIRMTVTITGCQLLGYRYCRIAVTIRFCTSAGKD